MSPTGEFHISDWIVIEDLAEALNLKPFKVVARLLEMRQFKHANEAIDFETATIIAREHGYPTERLLPGSF